MHCFEGAVASLELQRPSDSLESLEPLADQDRHCFLAQTMSALLWVLVDLMVCDFLRSL